MLASKIIEQFTDNICSLIKLTEFTPKETARKTIGNIIELAKKLGNENIKSIREDIDTVSKAAKTIIHEETNLESEKLLDKITLISAFPSTVWEALELCSSEYEEISNAVQLASIINIVLRDIVLRESNNNLIEHLPLNHGPYAQRYKEYKAIFKEILASDNFQKGITDDTTDNIGNAPELNKQEISTISYRQPNKITHFSKPKDSTADTTGNNSKFLDVITTGDSKSGKSCLILRFADDTFTNTPISCLGVQFKIRHVKEESPNAKKIKVWEDGQEKNFHTQYDAWKLPPNLSKSPNSGILLLIDMTDNSPRAFSNMEQHLLKLSRFVPDETPRIIVGTKADSLTMEARKIAEKKIKGFAERFLLDYQITSAKTGYGVQEVFEKIADKIIERKEKKILPRIAIIN